MPAIYTKTRLSFVFYVLEKKDLAFSRLQLQLMLKLISKLTGDEKFLVSEAFPNKKQEFLLDTCRGFLTRRKKARTGSSAASPFPRFYPLTGGPNQI